jgi:uncharacterized phage protein (TIGR01671 family)
MRQIKFRRYHFDFNGKLTDITQWGFLDNGFGFTSPAWISGEDKSKVKDCQFTGLQDNNGKDIYEGDVVKSLWQHDGYTNYDYTVEGVVEWEGCRSRYCIHYYNKDNEGWYPLYGFEREEFFPEEIEVIGNIYEHPHLLNTDEL